jgi:hypothetical protein
MKAVVFSALTLSIPALLAFGAPSAKAVLNYNIYESAGNLVLEASGSLALPSPGTGGTDNCGTFSGGASGFLYPPFGGLCSGPASDVSLYEISGPQFFPGIGQLFTATSTSGLATVLLGLTQQFGMDIAYVSGSPIVSSATFGGKTLADYGWLPTTGSLGTWTLSGTGDTINVQVTTGPSVEVPGPLPVLGAGAVFGFSRRLRRRIHLHRSAQGTACLPGTHR